MADIKLVALDMDGTLLDEHSRISEENRSAIADVQAAGVTVIFATGRGIPSLEPYRQELALISPIVAVNGSEVWRGPGDLHVRHSLPLDDVMALREVALRESCWYWAYSSVGVFNRENWDLLRETQATAVWLKFGYLTAGPDQLSRVRKRAKDVGEFEFTNSHPLNIEINPLGVTKATGVRDVCTLLGISMAEVMAVGDSLNDAALLREAGVGVAMGNAQDEVKELADAVTGTNQEDGVAQAIRRFVLNRS